MAIDKALNRAPLGLASLPEEDDPADTIEIEIEDPEAVHIGIGDLEIDIEPGEGTAEDFDANLAEFMDDKDLSSLVGDLIRPGDDRNRVCRWPRRIGNSVDLGYSRRDCRRTAPRRITRKRDRLISGNESLTRNVCLRR